MSQILWANNASSTLATSITSGATSLSVSAGTGVDFPVVTTGTYFLVTLSPASGSTPAPEIVKVTAVATDTFTIVRAQEGTTASAWGAGTLVQNLLTEGTMAALLQTIPSPGNPNGNVAGVVGSSGQPPTTVWDYTNDLFYFCTMTGTTSTAQWSALAPLNSPTFTGTPAAPTASTGTDTTQLATTAFVQNQIAAISDMTVFTVSGSTASTVTGAFSASAGCVAMVIELCSGGGGGGGQAEQSPGGGGAGGYAKHILFAPFSGTGYSYTIGTSGKGTTGNGGAGGNSYLSITGGGGILTCIGGSGGQSNGISVAGGAGGTVSGANILNIQGGYGNDGTQGSSPIPTGMGGASFFGGGTRAANGGGLMAAAIGSGGGANYGGSGSGSDGAVGILIVTQYFV